MGLLYFFRLKRGLLNAHLFDVGIQLLGVDTRLDAVVIRRLLPILVPGVLRQLLGDQL